MCVLKKTHQEMTERQLKTLQTRSPVNINMHKLSNCILMKRTY